MKEVNEEEERVKICENCKSPVHEACYYPRKEWEENGVEERRTICGTCRIMLKNPYEEVLKFLINPMAIQK